MQGEGKGGERKEAGKHIVFEKVEELCAPRRRLSAVVAASTAATSSTTSTATATIIGSTRRHGQHRRERTD